MKVITPPDFSFFELPKDDKELVIFLAGSIEQGKAEEWQTEFITKLPKDSPVVILNPRRAQWDSSWVQSIENDQFREQVEWELVGMEHADFIVMYLAPGTSSIISLMELGLHAQNDKLLVFCPEGFQRKGNVDIVCAMYEVAQFESWEAIIDFLDLIIDEEDFDVNLKDFHAEQDR